MQRIQEILSQWGSSMACFVLPVITALCVMPSTGFAQVEYDTERDRVYVNLTSSYQSTEQYGYQDYYRPLPAVPKWNIDVKHAPPVACLRNESKVTQNIRSTLDQQTDLEFVETPLKEIIAHYAARHNIQIVFDEAALLEEGLDREEHVTHHVSGVSLKSALKLMLEPLQMTYVIDAEVLKITTQNRAVEMLKTHVYDIRKLTTAGMDYDSIIQLLMQETTGPWFEIDGEGGTMSEAPGMLVMRQTDQVHEEAMQTLKLMEKVIDSGGQYKITK